MRVSYWLFLSLFCISLNAFAGFKWAKTPDCFSPIKAQVDKSIPASEIVEGCFYMILDLQSNLNTKQQYYHYAYKLTSENGVQNNSEIQIVYNPSYQQLLLHSIKVYRKGKYIDYSSKVKIKELQREEDLNSHIYDESLTLYIILEDIHSGDVVDYSYTREGANPILENFVYNSYSYQMSYTLLDFSLRIIKPKDLTLYLKNHESDLIPEKKQTKFGEELIWRKSNIPGVKTEKYVPSWYYGYSFIEISSSNDWGKIRDWGKRIFNIDEPLNDSLKKVCKTIVNANSTEADRTMAALRFVQKNIRYLGIEIGESSHKPHSPNKVYKQGFGDCKDKSLLLVQMLKEMGINAYPALVSTTDRAHVKDFLPSPTLFNHAVVKVETGNKSYWVDPTRSNQGGDINNYYFSSYGNALVLNGNSGTQLDTVITNSPSSIKIEERFDVRDFVGDARLYVNTTYTGCEADEIRYTFASSSLEKIQENYLDFYKKTFLKIDTLGVVFLKDDSVKNEVTVCENYLIKDFWKVEDSLKINSLKALFLAYDINAKLNNYSKNFSHRKDPLYLENPLHLGHTIIINLPEEWTVTPKLKNIDNEFFSFTYQSLYKDKCITLVYDYQTKKDFVQIAKAAEFIDDIDKASNLMTYSLTYNNSASTTGGGRPNLTVVLVFLIFIGVASYFIYTHNSRYVKSYSRIEYNTEKIGGWVVIPIIGLFATSLISLLNLFKLNFFSDSLWQLSTVSNTVLYRFSLSFELLVQALLIILPIFLLTLAFRYDKRFPLFMIYFYALAVVLNIVDLLIASTVPEFTNSLAYGELIRSVFLSSIWIPFFHLSDKCKRVFVK